MRSVFVEHPPSPDASRKRERRLDGRLVFGLAVVTLLVFATVLNLGTSGGTLPRDLWNQPPHLRIAQALLYDPDLRLESVTETSILGDLFRSDDTPGEAAEAVRIHSRPTYTAVAGRPYAYTVRARTTSDHPVRFSLGRHPEGMSIDPDSGRLTWTPTDSGHLPVEVVAALPDGTGQKQSFTLHTSIHPHLLGTDSSGRDVWALLVRGTQWTLLPGLVMVSVAVLLGLWFGGLAGYYGGRTDQGLSYVISLTESMPALVLLFLAAVLFRQNLYLVMAVLGVIWFPRIARAVRMRVQTLKARQFIEASRELGLRDAEILWRDILWYNTRSLLVVQITYGLAFALLIEVTLSFLRLGVSPPEASWGLMLLDAYYNDLGYQRYWTTFFPCLALMLSVAGLYALGDAANEWD